MSLPARKIITAKHVSPWPQMDWLAHFDGEEELGNYGYGETEQQAIQDLLDGEGE